VKVLFAPAAQYEHLAQVEYYEGQQFGLGTRYLSEMSAAIALIAESPARFPVVRIPNFRRFVLQDFPYSIIFRVKEEFVEIIAIAGHRREPGYWARR
jgi:plasmid stabilization system protein ParE